MQKLSFRAARAALLERKTYAFTWEKDNSFIYTHVFIMQIFNLVFCLIIRYLHISFDEVESAHFVVSESLVVLQGFANLMPYF